MHEELVKRLRHSANFAEHGLTPPPSELREAADAIEELSNAGSIYGKAWTLGYDAGRDENRPRWIPVKERLPEDLTRVIVFCEDGVSYGLCDHLIADDEEVVEWHDFLHYPITPTYWMPLPEPPKEGK